MPRRFRGSAAVPAHRLPVAAIRRALREDQDPERQRAAPRSLRVSSPPALETARQPGVRRGVVSHHVHGPLVPGGCSADRTHQGRQ